MIRDWNLSYHRSLFQYFILIFLIILSVQGETQLSISPHIKWKEIETKRFKIIYPEKEHELALLTLIRLEAAYSLLAQTWTTPQRQIPVLIRTDSDLSNGYATILPYPHIVIFPITPSFQESIGEYHDWLYELCLHELIHIFTFEQRHGLVQSLFYIFGNILTPNALLPRWWLEGVAVDGESRLSTGGRMRSLYQEAFIRAIYDTYFWNHVSLSSINEFQIPIWPYFNRPYLFGSLYWNFLSLKHPSTFSGLIHKKTGSRSPYLLSDPIQEYSFVEDLNLGFSQMKSYIHQKATEQINQLETQPFSSLKRFSSDYILENQNPALSPDKKKLLVISRYFNLTRGITLFERSDPKSDFNFNQYQVLIGQFENPNTVTSLPIPFKRQISSDSPWASTIGRMSWFPNSNQFVYDLISPVNRFEMRSDLWIYDLKEKKAQRLTKNLRAREPTVSPDGEKIAYIQLTPTTQSLLVLHIKSKKIETLYKTKEVLHWPIWINNEEILVVRKNKEKETLLLINKEKKNEISSPCPRNRYPNYRGSYLMVTCDFNGVWNIFTTQNYLLDKTLKWHPISHVKTGILTHDFDETRNEIYLTEFTSEGLQLSQLEIPQTPLAMEQLPKINLLFAQDYPKKEPPLDEAFYQDVKEKNYSSWKFLIPQYWVPFIFISDKSTSISILTSSYDPTNTHNYQVNLLFDQLIQETNYLAAYQYRSSIGNLQILNIREVSYLTNPNQRTTNQILGVFFEPFIFENPFINTSFSLSQNTRSMLNFTSDQIEMGVHLNYRFFQTLPRFAIPIGGRSLNLSYRKILPSNSNISQANLIQLNGDFFISQMKWWAAVNRLKLSSYLLDSSNLKSNFAQTQSWQIGNSASNFIMRGYPTGGFWGSKLYQFSYEHWLPGVRIDQGYLNLASYFHQISFGVISDFLASEGFGYSFNHSQYIKISPHQIFSSLGIETLWDFNIGYHFDMQMVLAWYWSMPSVLGPDKIFGL